MRAATLDDDGRAYWRENRRRIATALARSGPLLNAPAFGEGKMRVLDVGPSLEALLFRELFPGVELETLGWEDHRYRSAGVSRHHPLDLNEAAEPARCPGIGPFGMVFCLEVIEHLHIAPVRLLRYLHGSMEPGGYLILSTPNAAFLRNRWRMLCGRNPFEPLREGQSNPGHFRESTRAEMTGWLVASGYEVALARVDNLYEFGSASGRWFTRLSGVLPADFRHDLFFVARRPL
jgi:hypothetical protein